MNCHQCKRKDKGTVVNCSTCPKQYCPICIVKWYPLLTEEFFSERCPRCRGTCNCIDCLWRNPEVKAKDLSVDDRVYFCHNVICSGLFFVTKIHDEKTLESSSLLYIFFNFCLNLQFQHFLIMNLSDDREATTNHVLEKTYLIIYAQLLNFDLGISS